MTARHGDHHDFVSHYEDFLDAVHEPTGQGVGSGRWTLMSSIATELRNLKAVRVHRGSKPCKPFRVLDCAAGTGFPMIELAKYSQGNFEIHCTDGDPLMIDVLARRAKELDLDIARLAPERWSSLPQPTGPDALVLDWSDLPKIKGSYDYVLCRGNSLAYADTWVGGRDTASEKGLQQYLIRMILKVKSGGHLHVDAPRTLELPAKTYRPPTKRTMAIWEAVTTERGCRQWQVSFKPRNGPTVTFKRFSSLLTIDRVQSILSKLGLEIQNQGLHGERPGFGVIIARRPPGWEPPTGFDQEIL